MQANKESPLWGEKKILISEDFEEKEKEFLESKLPLVEKFNNFKIE